MKRGVISFLCILVLFCSSLVLSLTFVSAYTDVRGYVQRGIDSFVDIVEPVLQALFGGANWNSAFLFEKLLIFIVLAPLVYLSLKNIPAFESQPRVLKLIAFIVPLIGIRYLDYGWIEAILFQYQILAIALAGILPFILFFFFIHNIGADHPIIRKVGWIFFIAVYFGLWSTAPETSYVDIYFWTMVAAVVFLLFDGTINRALMEQEMKRAGSDSIYQHIAKIDNDITFIANSAIDPKVKSKLIAKKMKQREWWHKQL